MTFNWLVICKYVVVVCFTNQGSQLCLILLGFISPTIGNVHPTNKVTNELGIITYDSVKLQHFSKSELEI